MYTLKIMIFSLLVQDGTRLIDVASHLKQMSIIDILGTDVDSKPASQLKEPHVNIVLFLALWMLL